MVVTHHVTGYEKFLQFMEGLKVDAPIFVLYSGTKLDNGQSWCPDCVEGDFLNIIIYRYKKKKGNNYYYYYFLQQLSHLLMML